MSSKAAIPDCTASKPLGSGPVGSSLNKGVGSVVWIVAVSVSILSRRSTEVALAAGATLSSVAMAGSIGSAWLGGDEASFRAGCSDSTVRLLFAESSCLPRIASDDSGITPAEVTPAGSVESVSMLSLLASPSKRSSCSSAVSGKGSSQASDWRCCSKSCSCCSSAGSAR